MKKTFRILTICLSIVAIFLLYVTFIERYDIQENTYEIYFDNLPQEFDNFKILVIADLHFGFRLDENMAEKIIQRANSINADAIFGLGDYVRRRPEELKLVWPYLKKLNAPYGVYMVNGNHDEWASHELSLKLLEDSGYSVRHRHKYIKKGNSQIAIAGTGDYTGDEVGMDKALQGIPSNIFRILLTHNPDVADLPHKNRVDLFVSGHTHGGQFVIPFTNYSPVIPVNNKNYDKGIKYNNKNEPVFISKGIGCAIISVRFNCNPELAIIELKSKKR